MNNTLATIQKQLKAPKDRTNTHGKYKYRNAEDILGAFKTVQPDDTWLTMSDAVTVVGGHMFLVATVKLHQSEGVIAEAQGCAMHPIERKGMDASQITGACSSYARKYALCGLFAIDDSDDDPDAKPAPEPQRPALEPNRQPPQEAKRDPKAIAESLINVIAKIDTLDAVLAFPAQGSKSDLAWKWLADNDKDQSSAVQQAWESRIAQLNPQKPPAAGPDEGDQFSAH